MPPTGSISDPSQESTRCSRSVGRMKSSSGPTTVGPDTTRMAPSIRAALLDMPSSSPANTAARTMVTGTPRSEEHTSELQSQSNLVCRLLLEKKHIALHGRREHERANGHHA